MQHDKAWAVERLGILIAQTWGCDEYCAAYDLYKRGEITKEQFPRRVAEIIASKCGDDKVLIDAMEASLIPGLRGVNDDLVKFGKSLNVLMNGNRLAKLELVASE